MAGRQFKCGGCGKILEVPASSQPGDPTTPPRAPRADAATTAADAGHGYDHGDDRGGMPVWMQATLLVLGGILLVAMLLLCLGVAPFLWMAPGPGPGGGPGGDAAFDEVAPAVQPPPVVKPAQKE
jgi:hypothetical protein